MGQFLGLVVFLLQALMLYDVGMKITWFNTLIVAVLIVLLLQ